MSAPSPSFGAPSLGPADRIPEPPEPAYDLAWDSITPAAWRAFGEPTNPKENTPMGDHNLNGGYGHQPIPAPPAPPAPQK